MPYSLQPKRLKHKNLRRHRRYSVEASVQVSWIDMMGRMKTSRTQVLDVSEDGMALHLPEPTMPLRVRFVSERCDVRGLGIVRYCRGIGGRYVVGLEFADNLHWRAPQEDIAEPIALCEPAPLS